MGGLPSGATRRSSPRPGGIVRTDDAEFVADLDRTGDGTENRAARLVKIECPLDLRGVRVRIDVKGETDVDALNHKDAVFCLYVTGCLRREASFGSRNLTRLQRASQCAR